MYLFIYLFEIYIYIYIYIFSITIFKRHIPYGRFSYFQFTKFTFSIRHTPCISKKIQIKTKIFNYILNKKK